MEQKAFDLWALVVYCEHGPDAGVYGIYDTSAEAERMLSQAVREHGEATEHDMTQVETITDGWTHCPDCNDKWNIEPVRYTPGHSS